MLSYANTWLTFDSSTVSGSATYSSNSEYCEIKTTGGDPNITTYATGDMHFKDVRLEFYYQASDDIDDLQLFFCNPLPYEDVPHISKACLPNLHNGNLFP